MRYLFPLFLLVSCLLTLLPGCEPKEDMVQTSGKLAIDQDTILFDTVFTSIRTVTKRLWVYNHNSGAVKTDISLGGTAGTTYRLIIGGDVGPTKSGVLIRGNDSLLILVQAQLGATSVTTPFLITDQINFTTNGNQQNIKLVAYGQNAYFHRADIIISNTTWHSDKPHVIINSPYQNVFVGVYVGSGATLTISPGAQIYCHSGATIQVNGTLNINGGLNLAPGDTVNAKKDQVLFQGDRLESFYRDIPGEWGGIFFTGSSHNNVIRYTEIKNATFGVSILNTGGAVPQPDLLLENDIIRNISGSNPAYASTGFPPGGIVGVLGRITATNCLVTNCAEYLVQGYGGSFNFNFCTLANYTSSRQTSSLTFSNALQDTTSHTIKFPLSITLTNSIVWGSIADELDLDGNADYYPGSVNIKNCLLRTHEYAAAHDSTGKPGLGQTAYNNSINSDPNLKRTPENAVSSYDYRPVSPSDALTLLSSAIPMVIPLAVDLRNVVRNSTPPVLGAYEKAP